MKKISVIKTTYHKAEEAYRIRDYLLERALCACVNITEISSSYIWKGEIKHEREFQVEIKTQNKLKTQVAHAIKLSHPYETPMILEHSAKCDKSFAKWVKESTLKDKNKAK